MPLSTISPRKDIIFIKRRLRVGEQPVSSTASTQRVSLRLTGSQTREPIVVKRPQVNGKVTLSLDNPVVRLNVRQSAIGSLVISGAQEFAWDTGSVSGVETLTNSDMNIPRYGNRKLIEFYKNDCILGLRNFKNLKRVAIWASTGKLIVKLLDNSEILVDSDNGNNVLYLSRIGNQLELRFEEVINNDFAATFGFR